MAVSQEKQTLNAQKWATYDTLGYKEAKPRTNLTKGDHVVKINDADVQISETKKKRYVRYSCTVVGGNDAGKEVFVLGGMGLMDKDTANIVVDQKDPYPPKTEQEEKYAVSGLYTPFPSVSFSNAVAEKAAIK
jgi:hypothetical protein